jgi:hypothetical protein
MSKVPRGIAEYSILALTAAIVVFVI